MNILVELIKELRRKTGLSIIECKKALEETKGEMQLAIEYLRKKGLKTAEQKKGRETKKGLVYSYIHPGNKIGVLVEVNCETDFVAKNEEMINFTKDIAMQIAASKPSYIEKVNIPEDILEKEKEIYRAQVSGCNKPKEVIDKIVEGRLENFYKEVCLLEQPFIKDFSIKVSQLLGEKIAKFGENIKICRFVRYEIGEKN